MKNNRIIPNLWFDGNAVEASEYYVSVFKEGKIINTTYYPKTEDEGLADFQKDFAGKVLTVEFEILGMRFIGINAGPLFKFNESVSFMIPCKDQAEIDYYWKKLTSEGGEESVCGWLKDKLWIELAGVSGKLGRAQQKTRSIPKNDGYEKTYYCTVLGEKNFVYIDYLPLLF